MTGIIVLIRLSDNIYYSVCGLIEKSMIVMYKESGATVGLIIEKLGRLFFAQNDRRLNPGFMWTLKPNTDYTH